MVQIGTKPAVEAQLTASVRMECTAGSVPTAAAPVAPTGSQCLSLRADLAENENIFEVHLASAELDVTLTGDNPATFVALDFFEHDTQATPVVSGSRWASPSPSLQPTWHFPQMLSS